MDKRPRIIDVTRKPRKCPVCGGEIVDIIYGTGDMTEPESPLEYRRESILGGFDPDRILNGERTRSGAGRESGQDTPLQGIVHHRIWRERNPAHRRRE